MQQTVNPPILFVTLLHDINMKLYKMDCNHNIDVDLLHDLLHMITRQDCTIVPCQFQCTDRSHKRCPCATELDHRECNPV